MKYSVVIPLYNKEKYIIDTVNSVLNQSFSDYEVIIVDDGSTDHSLEVAKSISSSKIKVIHQNNQGVAVARNTGILNAGGEYISFLDADDIWEKDYLAAIEGLTGKYPESDIFVTAYRIWLGNDKYAESTILKEPDGMLDSYWKTLSCKYDFVWTSVTTVRKKALIDAGMFRAGEKIGQDLDMWARVARNNPRVACSSKRCAVYNRMAENNARTRVRIAYAKAFIDDLEEEMASGRLDSSEMEAVRKKYVMKLTAYAFTCITNGEKKEAASAIKRWKEHAGNYAFPLIAGLYFAMLMPSSLNKWIYKIRLRIF